MTDAALSSGEPWAARLAARLPWLLLGLLVLLLGLRLQLVFTANVNWDEFLYLAKVHAALRGELGSAFQSFQAHFFAWLPWVSDNEVEQVVAARLVMFALALGSAGLLYLIGRRVLSPSAVLFALLCWQGFSYLVAHGTSFRADPICAFLILAGFALLLQPRRSVWAAPLAGVCLAVSLLVSIKTALFLPAFAGVFLFLAWERAQRFAAFRDALLFGFALGAGALLLYGLHKLSLPETARADAASFAGESAGAMFLTGTLFPRWPYFLRSLLADPVTWLAMAGGAALCLSRLFGRGGAWRSEAFLLLALASPLCILPLYRNAFPYFYVFILTPGVLLAGAAFQRLLEERRDRGTGLPAIVALAAAGVILAGLVGRGAVLKADETRAQHQLVAAVHQVFPEPVPYIDWAGMIARYPKVGFFMSSWGLEHYGARGRPIFAGLIAARRPLFLLTDIRALDLERPWGKARAGDGFRLFREDYAVLKAHYVPHWGPIWVAGKALSLGDDGAQHFEILIPGEYRLEAEGPVAIDGVTYRPGAVIALAAGSHRAVSPGPGQPVTLRWAVARPGPAQAPLDQPVYLGF